MVDGTTEREILQEQANLREAARWVRDYATKNVDSDGLFEVTESHICDIHYIIASNTSIETPGRYREIEVIVGNHEPPRAEEVSGLMREFVDTLNENWRMRSAIQIAVFSLWRLNWIHPFSNGNGRTSRLFSYLLMSMKIGYAPLPGREGFLVPEKLEHSHRDQYLEGLRRADGGDLGYLEGLIAELLRNQLTNV